ncbi:MAG: hypothetical protein LBE18_01465 [Planctomycetaceae bacterium]|nr:hypothetical protein [Planctomycetaceae bacterium]
MRLSLSVFIVTIMATAMAMVIGCQNPGFLGLHDHSPYSAQPVAGPGPGVIPPVQTPLPQMPLTPPGPGRNASAAPTTPSMYYPMSLNRPYDSPPVGAGVDSGLTSPIAPIMPVAPVPVIPPSALGNISASAATPNTNIHQGATSQILFESPYTLIIHYDAKIPGAFDSEPLICPAKHEFAQGKIYRLKLSNIPGRPGKELYPTLEIAPVNTRTFTYLVSCSIPISFTENDFDQVLSGNLITKVIYFPDREYQGLANAGLGTIVNTDLEPGVDPIMEAQNRGSILAIIRMGNKDLRLTENELKRREAVIRSLPPGVPPQAAIAHESIQSSIPHSFISGVDIPPYGTPMTKTTTGVPGPPQLPQTPDPAYRYPIIHAEPIPVPPNVRAYPPPQNNAVPYGYPVPDANVPYNLPNPVGYQPSPAPMYFNRTR